MNAWRESIAVRRALYGGFAVCSVLLIASLAGTGLSWPAPLVGTLIYGIPALVMYVQEHGRLTQREAQLEALRRRGGGSTNWEFDEGDDPTQPPTRKVER